MNDAPEHPMVPPLALDITRPAISLLEARLRALIAERLGVAAGAPHTVEDLVAIAGLHGEPTDGQSVPPVRVRAWLGPGGRARGPRLGRAIRLDAYTLQVLIDDARRAGRGARLDIVVARDAPAVVTAAIQRRLAHLAHRGVDVRIRPERRRRRHGHARRHA
jgi:hypothetical protein